MGFCGMESERNDTRREVENMLGVCLAELSDQSVKGIQVQV